MRKLVGLSPLGFAFVFALMLLVMFPAIAIADVGTAVGGPLSTVLGDIVQVLAVGLGTLLATLLAILVQRISSKFNVAVPAVWMEGANALIDKGIHYAEEKAKHALKNNVKLNSNEKLNIAAAFVLSMADDKKLVKLGEEKLKKLIESRLNQNASSVIGTMISTNPVTSEAAVANDPPATASLPSESFLSVAPKES